MKRFLEIDALRGIALIIMVIYHIIFDYHYLIRNDFPSSQQMLFGMISTCLFICLAGVSLQLSMNRAEIEKKLCFSKYFFRGAHIFLLGLLITAITYVFSKEIFVIFGVLHFIGLSIIIGYFFYRFKYLNLIFALLAMDIGIRLTQMSAPAHFFIFGYMNMGISSLDHFPIFPWFGVFLLGMLLAKIFYPNYKRRFENLTLDNVVVRALAYIGKNTLLIYFLHHPLIIAIFWILGMLKI